MKDPFLELSEKAWHGQLDLMYDHHPVHRFYEGAFELKPNVLALKGIAGFYILNTSKSLVMIDTGSFLDAERAFKEVRTWQPSLPVSSVIFTHHHVDHIFGLEKFNEEATQKGLPKPQIYANTRTKKQFDRYKKTIGWNSAINKRQFAIDLETFSWPDHYPEIDHEIDLAYTLKEGHLSFEIKTGRGETEDHVWLFVPEEKWLFTGDFFIWALPNAGNPQKVQRYVYDWACELEQMQTCEAELLLPGHGFPIIGKKRVQEALSTTSKLLFDMHNQTLNMMNKGYSLNHILESIKLPETLFNKPWLQAIYDHPHFLLRMIWREYGGWWDSEYDRLLPDSRKHEAEEWLRLSGSLDALIERALDLSKQDKDALACHIIETAYYARPLDTNVHDARSKIYKAYSKKQDSSMARNILNHAALSSRKNVRDSASEH